MRFAGSMLLALLALAGCSQQDQWQSRNRTSAPNALAQGVLDEINVVRTSPATYAKRLDSRRPFYSERVLTLPGHPPIATEEGVRALDDAVAALSVAQPEAPIAWSNALANTARQVGRTAGRTGAAVEAAPERATDIREALAFGSSEPDAVVARLLIDDGIKDRADRALLLDPTLKSAGVACGPHARYGTMCVIEMSPQSGR